MKILITGVHGYVGSNLVESLKDDHVIYGLDIFSQKNDGIENTFHWIALDDLTGMELGAVIHLDNYTHNDKIKDTPIISFDERIGYTQKIFDYFLASDIKKFIFLSSMKSVADGFAGDVLTEDTVPSPSDPIGKSKLASENYILSKQAEWEAKGKEVYILRPSVIHGPGSRGSLNLLYNVLSNGIPWPLGSYENKRTFTYIDNLCYVVRDLLTIPVVSGVYHVADDETISTNELIDIISRTLDVKPRFWNVSKNLIESFAKLGTTLHLPLTTERLLKVTENYVVSNAKIKAALDIEQMPVRAKDGLERTVKSFN